MLSLSQCINGKHDSDSRVVKNNKEKKQKEKQEKLMAPKISSAAAPGGGTTPKTPSIVDRKHLHNYRVVQRNLVYVIGVPANMASEDQLRKAEYFGQYGKIGKIVIHRNHSSNHTSVSVYITFVHKNDAKAAIHALDGHWMDQHVLRASFGTTKYCNNFIRVRYYHNFCIISVCFIVCYFIVVQNLSFQFVYLIPIDSDKYNIYYTSFLLYVLWYHHHHHQ